MKNRITTVVYVTSETEDLTAHLGSNHFWAIAERLERQGSLGEKYVVEDVQEGETYQEPLPEVSMDDIDPETFKEYVQESIHNGWDGFGPEEVRAIMTMLTDLGRYHTALKK